jgi:alpha-tubulin suppressor-like RCC1 family protein
VVVRRRVLLTRSCFGALVAIIAFGVAVPIVANAQETAQTGTFAWGWGREGALGNGEVLDSSLPRPVCAPTQTTPCSGPLTGVVQLVAGGEDESYALLANGHVLAWGKNEWGQLGDGNTESTDVPVEVQGLSGVRAIAAGMHHAMALLSDGHVMVWGENMYGQLGMASEQEFSDVPVEAPDLSEVTAIAAGSWTGVVLLSDGQVQDWGLEANSDGVLGGGEFKAEGGCLAAGYNCRQAPLTVTGLNEAVAISSGGESTVALLRGGGVMAWGYNGSGQLGDGVMGIPSSRPVEVVGLREVSSVSFSGAQGLALLSDGSVDAWGYGEVGSLGDGLLQNSDVPVEVPELSGAVAIAAGWDNSLVLLENGHVDSWGWNNLGELGDGEAGWEAWRSRPVEVKELSGVSLIATQGQLSLAYSAPPSSTGEETEATTSVAALAARTSISPAAKKASQSRRRAKHSAHRRHRDARARGARRRHRCPCAAGRR